MSPNRPSKRVVVFVAVVIVLIGLGALAGYALKSDALRAKLECTRSGPLTLQSRPAGLLSAVEECSLKPGDEFKECEDCSVMVVVPPGSFTMGSPEGAIDRYNNEGPQHTVTIAKPFAVAMFLVTFDEFAKFVLATGYDAGSECWTFEDGTGEVRSRSWRTPGFPTGGTQPVVCLNWYDAKAYVAWIARKTGNPYRLLTETEWEYAARGRTEPVPYTRWFFGDDEDDLCRYGNVMDHTARTSIKANPDWPFANCSDGYAYAAPVGSFKPNGFGLYDMVGNSWQYTEDCYYDSYDGAPSDGSARTAAGECHHITGRGGGWSVFPKNLHTTMRGHSLPDGRFTSSGLRVARTLNR